MPYIDTGARYQYIGHCKTCKGQWVVTANLKGKLATHDDTASGRVCPFCRSQSVKFKKEDNR